MILSPLTISMVVGRDTGANALAMYFPPLLLEPILISFLGYTLGQYLFGITVIRIDSGGKCPFHASLLRYIAKTVLGSFSMVYMLFSKRHQAIHDHLAKTLVVLSPKRIQQNLEFASYGETELTFEVDLVYVYPSAVRRFALFCVWVVIALFVLSILAQFAAQLLIPCYTVDTEKMPKQIEVLLDFSFPVIFIGLAVLASKGRLPGAKRKSKNTASKTEKR
jgi:hypothetical protein